MRIAIACPYAWDDPGGVQTHVRELAERLLEKGHDVLVLAPVRRGLTQSYVRAVGGAVDIPFNASNAPIDPRPWSRAAVRRTLRTFGPDVVHVHEPLTPSTGMWVMLEAPAPVVATFHSGLDRSRLYDAAAPLLRGIARNIRVRIAVSDAAARVARARIGGAFEIVPNGVDVARFSNARAAELGAGRKLLFVGRLDERKGFPTAVRTFERLARNRPDLGLVVVGDGPDRTAVRRISGELRCRVRMMGAVANTDVHPYHAAADVYLGSSVGGESFGMVLVEAMAAGLPVVASDIAGYREVITGGVEGFFVPPRDPASAAAAVARILDEPGLAARMGAAGRTRARTYDWSVVSIRLQELYVRAIEAGPASLR